MADFVRVGIGSQKKSAWCVGSRWPADVVIVIPKTQHHQHCRHYFRRFHTKRRQRVLLHALLKNEFHFDTQHTCRKNGNLHVNGRNTSSQFLRPIFSSPFFFINSLLSNGPADIYAVLLASKKTDQYQINLIFWLENRHKKPARCVLTFTPWQRGLLWFLSFSPSQESKMAQHQHLFLRRHPGIWQRLTCAKCLPEQILAQHPHLHLTP